MDMVQDSSLASGLASSRVIPHGVDLEIYHPGDKLKARRRLGLPENEKIILMVANGFRNNPWKDFELARKALSLLSTKNPGEKITVLAIGDSLPAEHLHNIPIHFVPYIHDKTELAQYYQAADLLLSTSRVEVWGLAISEALACGTPVVATAVGGIPEQITSYFDIGNRKVNGILTAPGDVNGLAEALSRLLNNASLQKELGLNAGQRAKLDLDFKTQVEHTIAFYYEIINEGKIAHAR
jgi:glycosyltransferase involved in cell wall biosynthesis